MKVFITGATGFIGTAVTAELIHAGHQVLGMTRSEAGAEALRTAGAEPHFADLEDIDSIRRGAEQADAVIHTAFNHDFSQYLANCETDRKVVIALGEVLASSGRPLIVTSGTAIAISAPGEPSTEDSPIVTAAQFARAASEEAAKAAADKGVKVMVVRLPQVHDTRKQGLVTYAIAIAKAKGVSPYIGEGTNRWPAAHLLDVAQLYRLVLEKGEANTNYNAVDEEGVPMKPIAEAIAKGLNIPAISITPEQAPEHFGWMAMFAGRDIPASSALTRQRLGWNPTHTDLLTDLANMDYSKV